MFAVDPDTTSATNRVVSSRSHAPLLVSPKHRSVPSRTKSEMPTHRKKRNFWNGWMMNLNQKKLSAHDAGGKVVTKQSPQAFPGHKSRRMPRLGFFLTEIFGDFQSYRGKVLVEDPSNGSFVDVSASGVSQPVLHLSRKNDHFKLLQVPTWGRVVVLVSGFGESLAEAATSAVQLSTVEDFQKKYQYEKKLGQSTTLKAGLRAMKEAIDKWTGRYFGAK